MYSYCQIIFFNMLNLFYDEVRVGESIDVDVYFETLKMKRGKARLRFNIQVLRDRFV